MTLAQHHIAPVLLVALALTGTGAAQAPSGRPAKPAPAPTKPAPTKPAPTRPAAPRVEAPTIEVVEIPAGSFVMGASVEADERPPHRVTIARPFAMGKYEVTQAQWRAVMGTNPSQFTGDDLPVERVTWAEAQAFVKRLSAITNRTYRLPTEAEWEYACRAGSTGTWYFGEDERGLGRHAWYDENGRQRTHAVGVRAPNAWGLYDMYGNVWEWCEDWYAASGYAGGDGAVDPRGPVAGTHRVLRGGSYGSLASGCRSANRYFFSPDERFLASGLRVVLELPK